MFGMADMKSFTAIWRTSDLCKAVQNAQSTSVSDHTLPVAGRKPQDRRIMPMHTVQNHEDRQCCSPKKHFKKALYIPNV